MSEKEKEIIEKMKKTLPNMSDFDKGYILAKVEAAAEKKEVDKNEDLQIPEC